MKTLTQFDSEQSGTQEEKSKLLKNIKSRQHYIKLLKKGGDVLVLDFEVYPKLISRKVKNDGG